MLKLDVTSIWTFYESVAVKAIDQTLQEALDYAKAISPTETNEFVNSHKTQQARRVWWQVIWELVNDAPHANILEDGVQGKTYNYHKWPPRDQSTRIYSWVGNRTYQRTLDVMKPILERNLVNGSR